MKNGPGLLETYFEQLSNALARLFAHWVLFVLAVAIVVYWMLVHDWQHIVVVDLIRDIILCITFLSFFIIQKSVGHFSRALQLKLDELVATQEKARNELIKAEEKTEAELNEMAKEHEKLLNGTPGKEEQE